MPGNKRDLRFLGTTFFLSELFNSSFLMIIITTMISLVNVVMNASAHRLLAARTLVPERRCREGNRESTGVELCF